MMDKTPKGPPVLFLDVDGVLNQCAITAQGLIREKVELLSQIVQRTGCVLVISSTWRLSEDHRKRLILMANCYKMTILDWTPDLQTDQNKWDPPSRGEEIQAWLEKNPSDTFVILDDERDMGDLLPFAVFTESNTGLTPEIAEEVIQKLQH
jgi:hypothetical protein